MLYLDGRYIFKTDDRVQIIKMPDGEWLQGKCGAVLGEFGNLHDGCKFYLILLDTPKPDGTKGIVMISSCLIPAPPQETKH